MVKVQASNSCFYFPYGPSHAWSMRQSTQQPRVLYWRLSDFKWLCATGPIKWDWENLLIVDSVVESGRFIELVSETLRLSDDARGARYLADFLAAWSASSFDLTFSKILLRRPFLTSAVFSLIVLWGISDMAGVEYSNGGSASNGISSLLVIIGITGVIFPESRPGNIESLSAVAAAVLCCCWWRGCWLAPWAKWPEKKRMLQIKTNKQTKLIELSNN